MTITRRSFLAGAACLGVMKTPLLASALQDNHSQQTTAQRLTDGWEFYRGPLDAKFQVWHSEELVTWQKVTLPHCFNAYDGCDPDTPAYRGQGWYRRKLSIDNPYPQGRMLLHIEGAGQSSEVYIGTERIWEHVGGYDEFMVDITDTCSRQKDSKAVQLAILCDNGRDLDRMPSDLSDFTLYGGLYRNVSLVYVPAISFEAVHTAVAFEPGKAAHVTVTARLYTPQPVAGAFDIKIAIVDPSGKTVHQQSLQRTAWNGEIELASFELSSPQPWAPATPHLYRCDVTLQSVSGIASASHRFGVRHTRFEEHGPFYLNGERLLLRGTQRHEDHAGYAAATPESVLRKEFELIKGMGTNFIRLAHYQQSRLVLDLCDELGILVWEEVPWCRSGIISPLFRQRGLDLMRIMIDQHRNHPSVLFWGLGNEDDWPSEPGGEDHTQIRAYMTELRDLAHKQDPSRLTSFRRCDFAKDIPDVYSPSIWAGWYSGSYVEYRDALEKARTATPFFFHAEWGADSHAGRHAEDPDPMLARILTGHGTAEKGLDYKLTGGAPRMSRDGEWSETYACDLFDWYLQTQESLPWLTGTAQWVFKDFTTPLRVDNPVPRVNQKGVTTRDLTPKEGYYVFQSYWTKEPMVRIYGHNWPVRWGKAGQQRMVRVYSNCSEVELWLNGKSVGVKKRTAGDFPCSGLRWDLAFREGENELRASAKSGPSSVSDAVRFQYQTAAWSKPAKLALRTVQSTPDRVTVEARMLDATGVPCLDSRAVVRFSLAGNGALIDNLGTPNGSRVVQLYNGRAEISLRRTGPVVASVHAEGIESAFLTLENKH